MMMKMHKAHTIVSGILYTKYVFLVEGENSRDIMIARCTLQEDAMRKNLQITRMELCFPRVEFVFSDGARAFIEYEGSEVSRDGTPYNQIRIFIAKVEHHSCRRFIFARGRIQHVASISNAEVAEYIQLTIGCAKGDILRRHLDNIKSSSPREKSCIRFLTTIVVKGGEQCLSILNGENYQP